MHNSHKKKPLIQIRGLYKLFGKQPEKVMSRVHRGESKDQILADTGHTLGLRDINLDVKAGEIFVIMGLSGSGKSTLIRHFNRLIDPTEGEIRSEMQDQLIGLQSKLQKTIVFITHDLDEALRLGGSSHCHFERW
ncbi:ATP-binding cassette domain-containing protein [Endozoicomonas sp. YOMI1]|uniref:ATP-binding cassette domain-containing protein n=1 Tax=Endozoicomonas sp. YOMI1 TaxID=2828739 RepID=UPI0027D34A7E|nr:ATP-binding cassette domain-containing protein [Endozoicomonas sp. YOMI1]